MRHAILAETGPAKHLDKLSIRKFREKKSEPQDIRQNESHGYIGKVGLVGRGKG